MDEVSGLLLEGSIILAVVLVFIGLILAALIDRSARGVSETKEKPLCEPKPPLP